MKNLENINEELKGISPLLSSIEKPTVETPNALYFEQMQQRVWGEINQPTSAIQKENWLDNLLQKIEGLFIPKYALSYAVVLSFLVLSISYFMVQKPTNEATLSSLTDTEIQTYLAENIDEFEEQTLMQENAQTPSLEKSVSAEQINNYLENDFTTELL